MTTPAPPTATLAAWLEQQLAADEALAMAASPDGTAYRVWHYVPYGDKLGGFVGPRRDGVVAIAQDWHDGGYVSVSAHIAANDPTQTLRRVAAIRQVLALLEPVIGSQPPTSTLDDDGWALLCWDALRALAAQYADRDGYRADGWET